MRTKSSTRDAVRVAVETSGAALRDAAAGSANWLAICSLLMLLQSCLPAAQVVMVRNFVTTLSRPDAPAGEMWPALVGLTSAVGLMYPLGQVMVAATQRMGLRLRLRYRAALADAATRLGPARLSQPEVTTNLEASQTATGAMDAVAGKTLQLIGATVTAVLLCAAVWAINPFSGILVLAALLPTVLAFTAVARTEAQGWPAVAAFERRANYATEQLVQQRPGTELAILGSGHKVAALVTTSRRDAARVLDRMIAKAMRMELAAAVLTGLLFGGALAAMLHDDVSGPDAAGAVAGIMSGLNAVRLCGYAFGTIVAAAPQARIFRQFVASAPQSARQVIRPRVENLALEDITYTYPGANGPALKGVSIRAKRGEMIALVGVNGAGKTTAINCLVGMLSPSSGRVLLDGVDASTLSESERLGAFGLLVQEFGRFEFTLRETVALGDPEDLVDDDAIWCALTDARADTFARSMSDGLSTQLGQQWGGLGVSGGQWQRLALARIYLRNAGVWVLDEPTSAIDAEAERSIFRQLYASKSGRITIVVSHRAWTLKAVDRIYVVDGGLIVQEGTYAELRTQRDGRFGQIFAGQSL